MSRAAIQGALETLAAGDLDEAMRILLDAVEEPGRRPRLEHVCAYCGSSYEWPGLLDHHLRFSDCRRRPTLTRAA